MNPPNIEILPTKDGSVTLYLPSMDETYHSRHGAVCESMYVYLLRGVVDWYLGRREVFGIEKSGLRVFEMGFGTGLNAWLLSEFAGRMGLLVGYSGIEKFPLGMEIRDTVDFGFEDICGHWKRINGSVLDGLFDDNTFYKEHWKRLFDQDYIVLEGGSADAGLMDLKNLNEVEVCGNSMFYKFEGDVMRDLERAMPLVIDVVFRDAFARKKQLELWGIELFYRVFQRMGVGGVLVTYTANSQVRRNLDAAGFRVERLAGPPGKKHMLRAWR